MTKKSKEKIDFKYNLRIYWDLLKNYKGMALLVTLVILFIEATYTVDKWLFKIVVDRGTEFVAETLAGPAYISILIMLVAIYLVIFITRSIAKWLHLHLINRLDTGLMVDLKRKFFNHIIHLSTNFHNTHKTGSLISRLIRGSGGIERFTDVLVFNVLPLFFQLIVVGGALFYLDWLTGLVVFVTTVIFVAYSYYINRIQQWANLAANAAEDIEKANVSDMFTNIDSIKYFGKENTVKNRYKTLSAKTKKAWEINWDYFRWLDAGQSAILSIGTLLLVVVPVLRLLDGTISIGTLVFTYTVYGNIVGPLFGFVHGIRNFYRAMADFQDLFQYGKIENDIKDIAGAKPLKVTKAEIEFKNVTFSYHKRKILKNFSLKIPKNYKVALVGGSGTGKSTIVKLLYRLHDVNSGEILIDGQDIRNVKQESLRSELSIVPQECMLFDDTIYNNIAFSRPGATRKEVFNAIKFAQLDKIIKNFAKREKTIVGERGVRLSGGEKQRVSIARAILANKKILVLDEATSALDSETEHEIQKDLEKLMEGRTSIIIAHRLSTILTADMIVVLDNGRIAQTGTHRQLIKKPGIYKKLWSLQKGGYIK